MFLFFVSCEEKDCYSAVLVRIARFDYSSYCKHRHGRRQTNHIFAFFSIFELPRGTLRIEGKQDSVFPLGSAIEGLLNSITKRGVLCVYPSVPLSLLEFVTSKR